MMKASTTYIPNESGSRIIQSDTQMNGSKSSTQSKLMPATKRHKRSIGNELNADLRFDAARKREDRQKQQLQIEGTKEGKASKECAKGEVYKNKRSSLSEVNATEPN